MADSRPSFRSVIAAKILETLAEAMRGQDGLKKGNTVLVVDDDALRIVNACIPHGELVKAGFPTVSLIETKKQIAKGKRRPKHESLDVLYFMRPSMYNLERIIADYAVEIEEEKKDWFEACFPCIFKGVQGIEPEPAWYSEWRMLVLPSHPNPATRVPHNFESAASALTTHVESKPKELGRLTEKWRRDDGAARECLVQVMAYESSVFSLDMEDALSTLHKNIRDVEEATAAHVEAEQEHLIDEVAFRVVSGLVAMNEHPNIRYSQSSPPAYIKMLATTIHKYMAAYRRSNPEWMPYGHQSMDGAWRDGKPGEPPEPATLLVVDRLDDLAPALLHELVYSAMVTDLLHHSPSTVFEFSYPDKKGRKDFSVLLDEADPVWRTLRYLDFTKTIEQVDELRTQMAARQARRKIDRDGDTGEVSTDRLRQLLKVIADDEKSLDNKIALHYRMLMAIDTRLERRKMHEQVALEQNLATGVTNDGSKLNRSTVETDTQKMLTDLADMKAALKQARKRGVEEETDYEETDRLITAVETDQLRLLTMFVLCNKGLDRKTIKKMMDAAALSPSQRRTIDNLENIKVKMERMEKEARSDGAPFYDDETIKRNKKVAESSATTGRFGRYICKLEDIATNALAGSLSEEAYPWVKAPKRGTGVATAATGGASTGTAAGASAAGGGRGDNKYVPLAEAGAAGAAGAASGAAGGRRFQSAFAKTGTTKAAAEVDAYGKLLEAPKPRAYNGGRLIVFVLGGVTQLECAALDRLSKATKREIIIGSTSLLTAEQFFEQVAATETDPDGDYGSSGTGLGGRGGAVGGAGTGSAGAASGGFPGVEIDGFD